MSRWRRRRFLTILASGITWNQMRGPVTAGIDDAVRADSQLTVGKPDVAPPVVPGSEPFGGRVKHVSQGSRPEAGKQLRVLAVDDELESGRHRAPLGSAVARAPASMPRVRP